MNFGAWVMFAVGAIGLWGGLIVAIRHYLRAARKEVEGERSAES